MKDIISFFESFKIESLNHIVNREDGSTSLSIITNKGIMSLDTLSSKTSELEFIIQKSDGERLDIYNILEPVIKEFKDTVVEYITKNINNITTINEDY